MIIIHDSRIPEKAIGMLARYGNCLGFLTEGITHSAIAGHPDIFLCPVDNHIIAAPNTPDPFLTLMKERGLSVVKGKNNIGPVKENSAHYNAVITDRYIIHNRKYTDPVILEHPGNREFIHVNQGYTRCSLIPLDDQHFLTSDKGIEKTLLHHGLDCLYINNREILLPGVSYGFIGGCMGVFQKNIFIIGQLNYLQESDSLKEYLISSGYEVIELYDGKLYDGGSIFFFE